MSPQVYYYYDVMNARRMLLCIVVSTRNHECDHWSLSIRLDNRLKSTRLANRLTSLKAH